MSTIFVQIASYRDPDLPRTITSALQNARRPEALRFGVCWQYADEERASMQPWLEHPQVRADAVPAAESFGCGWARHRTNRLYEGETFMLQIDAHSRFVAWWDEILIEMLQSTGSDKPILSSYPPSFTRVDGKDHIQIQRGVQRLKLGALNRDLTLQMGGEQAPDQNAPGTSYFIAAGQLFTVGRFVTDVPYDPQIYFDGEEINLVIRAYTHGYDIFYPHRSVIHHLYGHGADKHWTDHPARTRVLASESRRRLRQLLVGDPQLLTPYGIGTERTVADYEAWAGIGFRERARQAADPSTLVRFDRHLELPLADFPDRDDYECFIFCLFDGENEVYRNDIYDSDILEGRRSRLHITADLDVQPDHFMLCPRTRTGGFGERRVYPIATTDR